MTGLPQPAAATSTAAEDAAGGDGKQNNNPAIRSQAEATPAAKPWWRRNIFTLLFVGLVVLLMLIELALAIAVWEVYRGDAEAPLWGPQVDLGYAQYAGSRLSLQAPSDRGGNRRGGPPVAINRFLGMRYAAIPTGDLRWRAPAPPPNATAPQPAKEFQPICLSMGVEPGSASGQDEDCLFVNVWAPANATNGTASQKLPVWVFIQGGGYTSNSNANWDGADVVARSGGQLVFVNFNYRAGLYGFLASERIRDDGALNVGLLDQRYLLAWVQKYIGRFGGDPHHVVIHGLSAGAGSAALHTVAYGGRDDGLFVGVAAQSVFFPTQPTVAELEWKYDRVADAVGCSSSSSSLTCLRNVSAVDLQHAANVASPLPGRTNNPAFYWGPCVDGTLLPARPYELYAAGRFLRVPMLYGVDTDEGSMFVANAASSDEAVTFLIDNYPGLGQAETPSDGDRSSLSSSSSTSPSTPSASPSASPPPTPLAASLLSAYYPLVTPAWPQHAAWFPTLAEAYGEATFICGAVNVLDAVADGELLANDTASPPGPPPPPPPPLFAYRFDMQDPDALAAGLGVPHTLDAGAVFGPDNIGCCAPASYYGTNAGLVPLVMDYYISFVRSLDPNTFRNPAAATWSPWKTDVKRTNATTSGRNGRRLVIQAADNLTTETVPDDQQARCQAWLGLTNATGQ